LRLGRTGAQSAVSPVFQKGQIAPQSYLSSVIVVKGGCQPFGAACTIAGPTGATIILPRTEGSAGVALRGLRATRCATPGRGEGAPGKADPATMKTAGVIRAHAAQVDLTSFRPR